MKIDDGTHRPGVVVRPLQPPFTQDVMIIEVEDGIEGAIALSKEDYAQLCVLLGGKPDHRTMVVGPADDNEHVVIYSVQ